MARSATGDPAGYTDLQEALEEVDNREAAYHIRSALQLLECDQVREATGSSS